MTLLKQLSERVDERGNPYTDFYLGWRNEQNQINLVRIRYVFKFDRYKLEQEVVEVPKGESFEKYID